MAENIIQRTHNSVSIGQRQRDGYVNLTAMAKAEGKLIADYLRLDRTEAFLGKLSETMGIPIVCLTEVKTGRSGGVWGHPQVAIHCGIWCSPEFAVLVTGWVYDWMTTGQNPLQPDLDRMAYRNTLKDDSRIRMTDQVKEYLLQIQKYDDKEFSGRYFARVHDRINLILTTETSKQMRSRLADVLGRLAKEDELIRDYFPPLTLQRYIAMCEATANLMTEGLEPLDAVERAKAIVLPKGWSPSRVEFVESIGVTKARVLSQSAHRQLQAVM